MFQGRIPEKQVQAIVALNSIDRYEHTIKQIVGWGKLWGLYHEGWAMVGDNEKQYLPIWPAKEYAESYKSGDWKEYHPKDIDLDDFLKNVIPDLREKNIFLAVFVTLEDKGVTPSYDEFVKHVSQELEKY